MEFLEKDLEEIIYLSDKRMLSDRGLYIDSKLKRQLRIGNYGIADLVAIARPYYSPCYKRFYKGTINIIELKSKKISVSTFFQALNYLKGIQTYLEQRGHDSYYNYKITLIGKDLDTSSSFCYLGDLLCSHIYDQDFESETLVTVDLMTYRYELDGLHFDQVTGYNLTNKGF
jgi:hypothetical protein